MGGGRLQQSWRHVTGNLTRLQLIPVAQLSPLNKVYSVLLNARAVPVPGECSAAACATATHRATRGMLIPQGLARDRVWSSIELLGTLAQLSHHQTPPRERVDQTSLSWASHRDSSSLHPSPLFQSCSHPFVLAHQPRLGAAPGVVRGDQEGTVLS